jgi:outer membrane protein
VNVLGLLFVAAAVSASAPADSGPRPISLAEAVALAQRNAPAVVQAEGQRRTSGAGIRSAYGAFLPNLSLSAGSSRQVPVKPGQRNVAGQLIDLAPEPWSFSSGVRASMDLFVGGRRFFDLQQARSQVGAAEVNLVTQRYGAALAAKQDFFNVLAARESEAAARAQLDQATQQLHTSVLRLKARVVTRSDSLRSEIQVHNARLAVLQARTALDVANASLTRTVGASDLVTATVDDSLDRPGLAVDDETLRALALDGPAVRQASASLDAARASLRGTWTGYLPSVTVSYSRTGSGAGSSFAPGNSDHSYSGSVNLALTLPLFNQFQREQQVTQAEVARDNAESTLRDARLAALEGLTQSLGAFHAAEERVATQTATVEAAEEDLREQQEKYSVGTSTLLDVLTSQTTLDQARHDLIQAHYDRRVAKAQLEALIGRGL